MRPNSALALLLLAVLALAPAAHAGNRCAGGGAPRPDEGGIGGTGLHPGDDAGGIGGTGLRPDSEEDDSGVGGTGISRGDTGVIGTITGFASICVGGVEIHYDASSQVRIDGRAASVADLAVGQVVEVVAGGSGDELAARQIGVTHLVAGPITAVDAEHNQLEVIGQTVRLAPATRGDGDRAIAAADFTPGAVVRVSGLRQADGVIAASRIGAGAADVAWVSGAVDEAAADTASVAGTPVRLSDGGDLAGGDEVRVRGRWSGGALIAEHVERLPAVPFDGRVGRLDVEGFASAARGSHLRVGRYVFEVPAGAAAELLPATAGSERVRIEAVLDGGRAVVQRLDLAPPLPPRPDRLPDDATALRPPRQAPPDGQHPPAADAAAAHGLPPRPGAMRPDTVARPQRPERPDRPGRPDVPDRPPIDRPPRPDRPPRIERPFRPERIAP